MLPQTELLHDLLSVLRAFTETEATEFADLKREFADLKREKAEVREQSEAVAATLDAVVKLAENIVFVRDYMMANLKAS